MAGGDASTGTGMEPEVDAGFEFAFDNAAFSDKLLRIEVVVGSSGDAPGSGADSASRKRRREDVEGTSILRLNTININSAILAAKSPFFFKRRMPSLELLRFMYSGKLTPTTDPTLLVDIFMAADKFEVVSCMKLCCQQLIAMPMTLESAVCCLDLPSSISMAAELIEAAKKFLSKRYREFVSPKFQGELLRIPLAGIEAIISRNNLGVASEVAVYDFVLRWGFSQYPNSEERHQILSSRLLTLLRRMLAMNNPIIIDKPNLKVKATLKRGQCSLLFPAGSLHFQQFRFAGNLLCLSFKCNIYFLNSFGLSLELLKDNGRMKGTIDYKIEAKTRQSLEYVTMSECTSVNIEELGECKDLFSVPWSEFIADDSPFFINDMLHLQIHLKITQKPL